MEDIAVMVVLTTLILTVGFVGVARPIMKPLARLLEAMVAERKRVPTPELARIRSLLEDVDGRLSQIEDRHAFYEALGHGSLRSHQALTNETTVDRTQA